MLNSHQIALSDHSIHLFIQQININNKYVAGTIAGLVQRRIKHKCLLPRRIYMMRTLGKQEALIPDSMFLYLD